MTVWRKDNRKPANTSTQSDNTNTGRTIFYQALSIAAAKLTSFLSDIKKNLSVFFVLFFLKKAISAVLDGAQRRRNKRSTASQQKSALCGISSVREPHHGKAWRLGGGAALKQPVASSLCRALNTHGSVYPPPFR